MKSFEDYVTTLEALIGTARNGSLSALQGTVDHILAGQPSDVLRDTMDLKTRREIGAFFTGSTLSSRLVAYFQNSIDTASRVFDPACGSGDLLLACTHLLPTEETLDATLEKWGKVLRGVDVSKDFIRATKVRLVLAAMSRHGFTPDHKNMSFSTYFPGVACGDGMNATNELAYATHVLLNPPFHAAVAPQSPHWGSGRVSTAAMFLDFVLTSCRQGARVAAILPDVLRSGSRYRRWRNTVDARTTSAEIEIWGLFSHDADIDVFILCGTKGGDCRDPNDINWCQAPSHATTLESVAEVKVGSVVPHRHPARGRWYPFFRARGLSREGEIHIDGVRKRRFTGTVYSPPFVLVRRTSRPDDNGRATGLIILGDSPVAVENHLLVVTPKDGKRETCELIVSVLRDKKTDQWLNRRIRCRHLTVEALRTLPLWNSP